MTVPQCQKCGAQFDWICQRLDCPNPAPATSAELREGCAWCNPRSGERRECCCKLREPETEENYDPDYLYHARELPEGPAFIPHLYYRGMHKSAQDIGECPVCRFDNDVPAGYLWQPAAKGTLAGWVRPHGAAVL